MSVHSLEHVSTQVSGMQQHVNVSYHKEKLFSRCCVQTSQMGALLHYSVHQYLNLIGTKGQFQNQISIKDEVHNTLWSNLQYYIINHCIIEAYGKNILPSRGKRKTYPQTFLKQIKHPRAQTIILQSLLQIYCCSFLLALLRFSLTQF